MARIDGLRQLGFSVLAIDYRGYGLSQGNLPNESQLYTDSQAAWEYLTKVRGVSAKNIIMYGESVVRISPQLADFIQLSHHLLHLFLHHHRYLHIQFHHQQDRLLWAH